MIKNISYWKTDAVLPDSIPVEYLMKWIEWYYESADDFDRIDFGDIAEAKYKAADTIKAIMYSYFQGRDPMKDYKETKERLEALKEARMKQNEEITKL